MDAALIVAATLVILLVMSGLAALRAPRGAMWPMQWDLAGAVTWRAPTLFAVLATPLAGALVLCAMIWAGGGPASAVLIGAAGIFLAAHAVFLVVGLRDVS